MAIVNGKEYLLYINAASEPATPDEIANYTLVGSLQDVTFTDNSEQLTSNNKDNGARVSTLPGNQSYSISGTVEWEHDDDAGQDGIWDAVLTTTVANKLLYWLITSNVTSDLQIRGNAYAVNWELSLPNNEIATASFELAGNGTYTKEAVDA